MQTRTRRIGSAAALWGGSVGLLAAAVVAVAFPRIPFPIVAVAEAVASATPGEVATFFIEALQHLALPLTVVVVAVGAAVVTWLMGGWVLPRLALRLGDAAGALVSAVPFWAVAVVAFRPDATTVGTGTYAAVVAACTGVGVWATARTFATLRGRVAGDPGRERAATDAVRRHVLRAAGVGGLALALGWLRLERVFVPRGAARARPLDVVPAEPALAAAPAAAFEAFPGLAPLITPLEDFYVVDEEIVDPDVDVTSWHLRVHGLVDEPLDLTYEDLLAMPLVEQHATLACISNPVGGDLISTATWTGVRLADVLDRAGADPSGLEVVFRAIGGYSDSLPFGDAIRPVTLVALGMNGSVLPREHGYPARLLAPGYYGMKQPKWLESIEVVAEPYDGYWERRGWIKAAVVRTWCRADGIDETDPGSLLVAGVAFAGDRGIDRVEVSFDEGGTWREAELEDPPSGLTWRRWRTAFEPGGVDQIVVRATDGDGLLQEATVSDPHPSGATGYDAVRL